MTLGETLVHLRKTKGLSQEQLAQELELTRQTISKWELNQSTPDIDYLLQLSDFFGVSTDCLLKGEQATEFSVSDKSHLEVNGEEHTEMKSNKAVAYKWCFYLGLVLFGVSLVGIVAFVICSAINPWIATVDDKVYEGLPGFLVGTNTVWFFVVLSVLFIVGCILSAYGIIKNIRLEK